MSSRWTWWLPGAAVTAALGLALVMSLDEIARAFGDNPARPPRLVLAVATVVWVVVTAVVVGIAAAAHRRTRDQLHLREQRIAADGGTSGEWVWETDLAGRFVYCNGAVGDLLGHDPGELLGRATEDLLCDEADRAFVRRLVASPAAELAAINNVRRMRWRHRDGHGVLLQGTTVLISDTRGRPTAIRGSRRALVDAGPDRELVEAARVRVRALLADRGFDIALQPIVSLTTGRLMGVEALARFRDGRSPEAWFDEAAMVGLGVALERAAWAAAVRLLPELPASVYLSVNASPALLTSAGTEALLGDDLRADRLVVELTEHAHVDDYPRLLEAMAPLRRRGVRFAVDDTGAGYSSFAHVLQVRPEIIKLDRTLITDLPHDRARRSLVTALVVLGMDIGASITGEGVETPEQLKALRSLGVGAAQGFLLAQPSTQAQLWDSWAGQAWQLAGSGSDALAWWSPS